MTYAAQRITRFGDYTFPATLQEFNTNFGDLLTQTVRLPGMSGGIDNLGSEPAAAEVGTIRLTFKLTATSLEAITGLKDDVMAMRYWGIKPLYLQPTDAADAVRWCLARVQNIQMNQDLKKSEMWQTVTITFQVPTPVWYAAGTEAATWGSFNWGDGTLWGVPAGRAVSGLSTSYTVTTTGKGEISPRILIACGAAESVTGVTIKRSVNGVVKDTLEYAAAIGNSETLEINCRMLTVKLDGVDAYSDDFDFQNPAWFRLYPGDNDITVEFDAAGDAATVTFAYYEAYY